VFSSTEFIPTNNSGVELAAPNMMNETMKVLHLRWFASFTKLFTTRSADFANTNRLITRIRMCAMVDIIIMLRKWRGHCKITVLTVGG
jgi:hypothetical protein